MQRVQSLAIKKPRCLRSCFSLASKNKRKWACCFVGEGKEAHETGRAAMNYSGWLSVQEWCRDPLPR